MKSISFDMMRRLCLVFALTLAIAPAVLSVQDPVKYVPVTKYDPQRNADQDIRDAVAEAQRSQRRILLEVGGEWCIWCHRLDDFFAAHPNLTSLRDKNFVTVKINFSEENPNKEVLSRYGPISAYPYIFVLDSGGKLVRSQETGVFEEGKSYDEKRLMTFLNYWSTHTEAN
jgi:thiol:disulfide interchange protein